MSSSTTTTSSTAATSATSSAPTKPIFELSLHGSINKKDLDNLLTRLDGLCGTSVHQRPQMRFKTWETVHTTQANPGAANPNVLLNPPARIVKELVEFRLVHEYDRSNDCWRYRHLKYLGRPLPSTKERTYKTFIRTVQYGRVFSDNIIAFLNLIKCEQNYEFVKKGVTFMSRNNIQIEVSQLYKMETLNVPSDDKIVCMDEDSYLIQMSCEAAHDEIALVESNLIGMADNLASIVTLYKEIPTSAKIR